MINKVTLIGRLGADPEVRVLEGGVAVARLSVATNEYYKDKEGNLQETTEWHNVVAWRDLAERAEKQLKKGNMVYVEGKISYRKYTAQDGQEKYVTDIVANNLRNLTPREGGGGGLGDARFPNAERNGASTPVAAATAEHSAPPPPVAGGDDLPF